VARFFIICFNVDCTKCAFTFICYLHRAFIAGRRYNGHHTKSLMIEERRWHLFRHYGLLMFSCYEMLVVNYNKAPPSGFRTLRALTVMK